MALLNRPGRVAAEFFCALCGFPGLGWLLSGSVFAGLVLICAVPGVVWGGYPAFLVMTGRMADGPFIAVQYLPGLALGSSALLAYREIQLSRSSAGARRETAARPPGAKTEGRSMTTDSAPLDLQAPPRLTTKAKVVILCSLVPVFIAVAVLPFILLAVPDPHPVKIPGLAGEVSGTYVQRQDGFYKLFPYTAPMPSFPADALVVDDPRPQVTVKFRQLDFLSNYGITSYTDSREITVDKVVDEAAKTLSLRPVSALDPGEYVIAASRDGADGGEDYFYFSVP